MGDISKELGLPNIQPMDLPSFELTPYGAATFVAQKLGIKEPPMSFASWQHGWNHADMIDIVQIAYDLHLNKPGDPELVIPAHKRNPYLVATKEQEAFLHKHGYSDAKAVGLPFAYIDPDPTTQRVPGSLLVMPTHALSKKVEVNEIQYLDYIASIANRFSRVIFCLHLSSLRDNQWINNLAKYGFDYVLGAAGRDENALFRMRKLFDSFEFMTSHVIGSHILYAAFCGVKVSMDGPYFDGDIDIYHNVNGWGDPQFMKKMALDIEMGRRDFVSKKFPWFFVPPYDAVPHEAWAKEEIGFHDKVSFEELARHFRWSLPQIASFSATVFRLDASDDFSGFVGYVTGKKHDPNEILSALTQLLQRGRLRSAYILAMVIAEQGLQNPFVSVALAVGGLVYNNPTEENRGLQSLQRQVDRLSATEQATLYEYAILPTVPYLLATALHNQRVSRFLEILKAAVPYLRSTNEWDLKVRLIKNMLGFGVLDNVNNTSYLKNCLMLYIIYPFDENVVDVTHQNQWQVKELARMVGEFGFNVDVVNYDDQRVRLDKKYDMVIDVNPSIDNYYKSHMNESCVKIAYLTMSNPSYANKAEIQRIEDIVARKGKRLKQRRHIHLFDKAAMESLDAIFLIGNDHTLKTYNEFQFKKVHFIRNMGYSLLENFDFSRKSSDSFLFLAGVGQVHKGLDLLLDVFSMCPHLKLYVASPYNNEDDFCELYRKELFHTGNVFPLGFLDIRSEKFLQVSMSCSYFLLPSCAEGQAGSVLTAMSAGLIPVVSRNCGFPEGDVYLFENCSIDGIYDTINALSLKQMDWIKNNSLRSIEIVQSKYSQKNYSESVRVALEDVFNNPQQGKQDD